MNIKAIYNERDYQEALRRLEVIFDADLNTKEGEELEILGALIDNYENIHNLIEMPEPVEAIKFRIEQMRGFQEPMQSNL